MDMVRPTCIAQGFLIQINTFFVSKNTHTHTHVTPKLLTSIIIIPFDLKSNLVPVHANCTYVYLPVVTQH